MSVRGEAAQAPASSLTLVLVRHAQAQQPERALADVDRALDRRGTAEAVEMARRLRERGFAPDLILASCALRARQTADAFARALEVTASRQVIVDALYLATPELLLEVLRSIDERRNASVVLLVAHNPGLSELAQRLAPEVAPAALDTCGMLLLERDERAWRELGAGTTRYAEYDSPQRPRVD